jgi:hypothetical protein
MTSATPISMVLQLTDALAEAEQVWVYLNVLCVCMFV